MEKVVADLDAELLSKFLPTKLGKQVKAKTCNTCRLTRFQRHAEYEVRCVVGAEETIDPITGRIKVINKPAHEVRGYHSTPCRHWQMKPHIRRKISRRMIWRRILSWVGL